MATENTSRKYTSIWSIKPKRKKVKDAGKITSIKNGFTAILSAIKAKHL
jgi:hypothetical protein